MDIIIIGSGHNGLVAATLLARKGLNVTVLEERDVIGGATKTECPFSKVPTLRHSTGSYLLGLMPPELISKMGARIDVLRRDPHYFLPTLDGRYLLFGSDKASMRAQFLSFFSENDWKANEALTNEIGKIREDLAPSWLEEPLSLENTAEKYIRKELRQVFIDLVRSPVEDYLSRFGFQSELLMSMYAVTDGFSGLTGSFGTPKTGMNFLVHNMCRLPSSEGTFMVVKGGMGSIAKEFARLAVEAGVNIMTSAGVDKILSTNNRATGVLLKSGRELHASIVVCNADPFRMREMVGAENLSEAFNQKLDGMQRFGTTMKVNMALKSLPTFACLPENRGQHNATIHLLPPEEGIMRRIKKGFEDVQKGQLAEFPTIEWYIHTQLDPSLQDKDKHHSSAFFVQWVPYQLDGKRWEDEEDRYVQHLFSIAEQFAPGFTDSIVEYSSMTPEKIEKTFGISYGHIHHIDNTFGFDERVSYTTPLEGLYSCSAGCHPAGSVIGAAGHNCAKRVLKDLHISSCTIKKD